MEAAGLGKGLRRPEWSWKLSQSEACSPSIRRFAFPLSGNAPRPMLAACAFVYLLFINRKSRKDLKRLTIKDRHMVKLLRQNRP